MKVPTSAHELREQVELHETVDLLTHVTYASIMTLLTAADRIQGDLPEHAARIRTWVTDAQRRDVRITQCITDAKVTAPADRGIRTIRTHTCASWNGAPTES